MREGDIQISVKKGDLNPDGILTREKAEEVIKRAYKKAGKTVKSIDFRDICTFISVAVPDDLVEISVSFLVVPPEGLRFSKKFP